jgi:hypothetical protein
MAEELKGTPGFPQVASIAKTSTPDVERSDESKATSAAPPPAPVNPAPAPSVADVRPARVESKSSGGIRWPTLIGAGLLGMVLGTIATTLVRKPVLEETRFVNFDANSRAYLGVGWSGSEGNPPDTYTWCAAKECTLVLQSRATGDRTIAFQLSPFVYTGAPQQTIEIRLNDRSLGVHKIAGEMSVGRLRAPRSAWRIGANELKLQFGYAVSPRSQSADGTGDGRTLSAALVWLAVGGSDAPDKKK